MPAVTVAAATGTGAGAVAGPGAGPGAAPGGGASTGPGPLVGAGAGIGPGAGAPVAGEETLPERPHQSVWLALKKHIIRERQRKKEEHEAEVEEERLRKEREARERQDVMTLGETREQIQQLEQKLTKLKEEKHQLFLQLKKVLNEDDNRKKQFRDSNEMMVNMNGMVQGGNMAQSQLFLPPTVSQGNSNMGRPPLSAHMLNKTGGGMKRGRSPSPPYASAQTGPHGGAPYMHHPHHKQHASPYQGPTHKMEDGRSREMARAVLWNKPSQYSSGGGGGSSFYGMQQPEQRTAPLLYTGPIYRHLVQHHNPPKQVQHSPYHVEVKHDIKKEPVVMGLDPHQQSYLSQPPPGIPPSSSAPPVQSSQVSGVRHSPQQQLLGGPPPMHQGVGQMQHNNVQSPKPGGITSGYPVRQQNPTVQNPNMYPNRHRY